LNAIFERLETQGRGIEAVLPPKIVTKNWDSCPLTIDIKLVFDEIAKVVNAVKGVAKNPCYDFIMQEHMEGPEAMAGVPENFRALAWRIKQSLKDCIPLLTKVHYIQRPADEEILSLKAYRKVFGLRNRSRRLALRRSISIDNPK
jgi:hypothetical protein